MSRILGLLLILSMTLNSGCYYEKTPLAPPPDPDVEISYSNDIQAYFDISCVGCHTTGTGIPLNLEPEVSYNNLINGGFIDTTDASSSILYVKIAPGGSMEVYATDQDRQNTLLWIEQGAKNN